MAAVILVFCQKPLNDFSFEYSTSIVKNSKELDDKQRNEVHIKFQFRRSLSNFT